MALCFSSPSLDAFQSAEQHHDHTKMLVRIEIARSRVVLPPWQHASAPSTCGAHSAVHHAARPWPSQTLHLRQVLEALPLVDHNVLAKSPEPLPLHVKTSRLARSILRQQLQWGTCVFGHFLAQTSLHHRVLLTCLFLVATHPCCHLGWPLLSISALQSIWIAMLRHVAAIRMLAGACSAHIRTHI